MPKVLKKGKTKVKQAGKLSKRRPEDVPVPDDDDDLLEGDAKGDAKMSRGKRKRQLRREGVVRKFEFENLARAQDNAAKHGGLADLKSLAGTLDEALAEGGSKPSAPKHAKRPGRKAQAAAEEREMAQFQGVLAFKAFQADPFGALEQHLKNSLKKQAEEEAGAPSGIAKKLQRRGVKRNVGKKGVIKSTKQHLKSKADKKSGKKMNP
eukprot:TRINITY_DN30717_c0_g1_i1.p1 TRINITY_DN30717_c0_g1~~TRINITY_DN30717_c0_g1_i1.p1  ORF type:complete len:208 (-),score=70.79 TRINITY_DN30717_c0_g1_i1:36-659(-)